MTTKTLCISLRQIMKRCAQTNVFIMKPLLNELAFDI